MFVKGVIKDRTLNLSLISIEEEYFRDTRIELFFFFFSKEQLEGRRKFLVIIWQGCVLEMH